MRFGWKKASVLISSAIIGAAGTWIIGGNGCIGDGAKNASINYLQQETTIVKESYESGTIGTKTLMAALDDAENTASKTSMAVSDDTENTASNILFDQIGVVKSFDKIYNDTINDPQSENISLKELLQNHFYYDSTINGFDILRSVIENIRIGLETQDTVQPTIDALIVDGQNNMLHNYNSLISDIFRSDVFRKIAGSKEGHICSASDDSDYHKKLKAYVEGLLRSIPDDIIPESHIDKYFQEFFEAYYTDVSSRKTVLGEMMDFQCKVYDNNAKARCTEFEGEKYIFPTTLIVVDKSEFTAYYYDFNIPLERRLHTKTPGELLITPQAVYKVAIGKHKGDDRSSYELKTTPIGMFWIDNAVRNPVEYYRKRFEYLYNNTPSFKQRVDKNEKDRKREYNYGFSYGPRLISINGPNEWDHVLALHGSIKKAQWTVGSARSRGCLRMYNDDIKKDLWERISALPSHGLGTLVVITN